jgi:hypothetical protein
VAKVTITKSANATALTVPLLLINDQGCHRIILELRPTMEEGQLDQERQPRHDTAALAGGAPIVPLMARRSSTIRMR